MKKTKKKYNNQTEEVNKALQKQNQHRRKISNLDDKAVEIIQRTIGVPLRCQWYLGNICHY